MLAEVVNGSDVALAIADLLEEETPTWAALRHSTQLAQAVIPQPRGMATELPNSSTSSERRSMVEDVGPNQASSTADGSAEQASGADSAEEGVGQNDVDRVLQDAEFQALAEYVLESACFSLLQKSAAGRWQDPEPK